MSIRPGGVWWMAMGLLAVNLGLAAAWVRTPPPRIVPPPESRTVRLSQASVRELATLPGIGPRLAERIAAYRNQHPGMRPGDLVQVRGIGPKKAERLAGLVSE